MKRLFLVPLLLGALLLAAPSLNAHPRQAAKTKRLSVLDYYFLLPFVGNEGIPKTGKELHYRRESLRPQYKPVVDLRHDYLSVQPDSAPRVQVAVFRGAADVVAYSAPDYQSDYNSFALYRLQNGKLRDVTKQLLPVPVREDRFLYELPRVGTTIRVFSFNIEKQSRKPAFDLAWRRGRFVKLNLAKAKR